MKKLCLFCIVGIALLGFSEYFGDFPLRAEVIDKIAAILDDELILMSEVQQMTDQPIVKILANLDGSTANRQDGLQYVIERRLLAREVQYLATPKELEPLKSLAMQYITNTYHQQEQQQFEQQLETSGVSEAELNEQLMLYMKGFDYIRRKYRFNADIDDQEVVMNLFEQWIKDLKAKAQIQILRS